MRNNCLAIQDLVLRQVLQLTHPVMPHITRSYGPPWSYAGAMPFIHESLLLRTEALVEALSIDKGAAERVMQLQGLISEVRALKAKYNLASKRDVSVFYGAEGASAELIADNAELIAMLAGLSTLQALGNKSGEGLPAAVTTLGSLYLDLSSSIDVNAEKARLEKELARLDKLVELGENKLKNPKFVEGAPEHVVAGARKQLAETAAQREETRQILASL